jgi:2'-5' RNA ligase
MARIRTFIAVDLGPEVRRAVRPMLERLERATGEVKWLDADNLHLTLKFLGDVEDAEIYRVCRQVQEAAADVAPFRVTCRGTGAFPNLQRPRTIWLGIDDAAGQLTNLQARVEERMRALQFPREERPFRPHVTIGRVGLVRRRLDDLAQLIAELAEVELGILDVDECVIYASELTPRGPIYTVLGRAPLGGREGQ